MRVIYMVNPCCRAHWTVYVLLPPLPRPKKPAVLIAHGFTQIISDLAVAEKHGIWARTRMGGNWQGLLISN